MCEPCTLKVPPLPMPQILSSRDLEEDRCRLCWYSAPVRVLGQPPGGFQPEDMLMAMKISEFEADYGFTASPEWFEEDIAHGNF